MSVWGSACFAILPRQMARPPCTILRGAKSSTPLQVHLERTSITILSLCFVGRMRAETPLNRSVRPRVNIALRWCSSFVLVYPGTLFARRTAAGALSERLSSHSNTKFVKDAEKQ